MHAHASNDMYVECYQRWRPVLAPRSRAKRVAPESGGGGDAPHRATAAASCGEVPLRLRIQQARLRRRQTQAELAQAMNVTAATIAAFETGKYVPTKEQLAALQHHLGGQLLQASSAPTLDRNELD